MAPRNNKFSDDDDSKKKKYFKQRFPGFKKKATELSVLCGNSVGFICYGPNNNDLHVWPEPQDNPQALTGIVGKFNALSDHKRKNHACDLYDFVSDIKGFSGEDFRRHIDKLSSHIVEIKQLKTSILRRRGDSKKPKPKETEEEDDHIRVSENATITNCNEAMMMPEDRLGFDEFPGYHETDSSLGSYATFTDVGVSEDSSLFDPFTFGDYFPVPPTDNFGVDGVWDLCGMDLEFSSLFPGYDPLPTDSFMSSYQTPVIEDFGSVF
ncbi:PREDICTED: agamous-like MADS-box protein AGL49 [Camelina sativa]|uniref:Agamous-like MADS-box protein AGL49 n=1 Tax=Camelina sativa TaxID=90675 RepID=A0ABM1QDG8_CAMSA|nr:PREDICTED: agamous-like MADS-box protein AGL49 [Camelina sativa]